MLYCFLSLHQRLTCWFSCFLSSIIESAVGFLDFGYCCIISPNSRTRHSQLCESTIINVHHFKRALLLHKNAKQLQIRKPNQLFRRLWQDAIIEKIVRAKNHRFFFFFFGIMKSNGVILSVLVLMFKHYMDLIDIYSLWLSLRILRKTWAFELWLDGIQRDLWCEFSTNQDTHVGCLFLVGFGV